MHSDSMEPLYLGPSSGIEIAPAVPHQTSIIIAKAQSENSNSLTLNIDFFFFHLNISL